MLKRHISYLLMLIICLGFFLSSEKTLFAQTNKIGVGYNLSFTKGYPASLLGLKLYYEKSISSNFSLRGNVDYILPEDISQLPIEISALYFLGNRKESMFFFGAGVGYYLLANNRDHGNYYYENGIEIIYEPFDENVVGFHVISGVTSIWDNISLELKYIILSVNQNETLNYTTPNFTTKKRIKKVDLSTFRLSLSYNFDF